MIHKIPLTQIGLDCEKIKECDCSYDHTVRCHEETGYNYRTAENAKSVLEIDLEKFAKYIHNLSIDPNCQSLDQMTMGNARDIVKHLSQNATSFMKITKGK